MSSNVIIIYDNTNNESLVKKNKCKKENPNAVVISSSNTEAVSEALKGKGNVVYNFAGDLDKRHLKGDEVVNKKPAAKKKAPAKKPETKKKAAPKKKATTKKK